MFHQPLLQIDASTPMDKLGKQIARLRAEGWTMYYFGTRDNASGLGATKRGDDFADVVVVRHAKDGSAFRVPLFSGVAGDLFKPTIVSWQRHGKPVSVIRAIRHAPAWDSPENPTAWLTPDPLCRVPESWPEPVALPPDEGGGNE
ncbi:hypothetical protein GCM10009754_03970 [Amycolatopsis minnesotensis]|uniref:Uncharacterized protein n=1 Tax=Amycolatopsis minnesotensis TaxID=337894 RepID=A0ABN2Q2U6_9PSEU